MKYTLSVLLLLSCFATPRLIQAGQEDPGMPEATPLAETLTVAAAEEAAPAVVDPMPVVEPVAVVAEPAVVEPAVVVVEPTVEPVPVVEPVVEPAPVVVAPVATNLPTEDDITTVSRLIAAYKLYVNAMQNVHEVSTIDATSGVADEALVKSLLNLLAIHKKEEALIDHLRGSIASLKEMLNTWEDDVEQLLKEKRQGLIQHHHGKKPHLGKKHQKRTVDFEIVKDQSSKPRPQK